MNDFVFYNPTRIVFGEGTIAKLSRLLPANVKILLLYGGGSIKRNGVYGQVLAATEGRTVVEFGGIEANPQYATCLRAVEVVKAEKIGFVLAVGGGSVMDAAKFIAAAAMWSGGEPWAILGGGLVKEALPLGVVCTLPATGSESNPNAVISRAETEEKLAFASEAVFPRFAILDPTVTTSLPLRQIRNGLVDAFVHILEQYATVPCGADVQDRLAEGLLLSLIDVAEANLRPMPPPEARANFVWAATLALNTLIGRGGVQDWSTHMIGHELTAFYGLDHAQSLAIVLPGLWRRCLEGKRAKLTQYGQRVWGVQTAEQAIDRTEAWFESLEMPTRLSVYGIDAEEAAEKLRTRMVERGMVGGEGRDITPESAATILRSRARAAGPLQLGSRSQLRDRDLTARQPALRSSTAGPSQLRGRDLATEHMQPGLRIRAFFVGGWLGRGRGGRYCWGLGSGRWRTVPPAPTAKASLLSVTFQTPRRSRVVVESSWLQ